jgi:hypothetical protein
MVPTNIKVFHDWSSSNTLSKLHIFLGLTKFYHKFVLRFSDNTWELISMTKDGAKAKLFWVTTKKIRIQGFEIMALINNGPYFSRPTLTI